MKTAVVLATLVAFATCDHLARNAEGGEVHVVETVPTVVGEDGHVTQVVDNGQQLQLEQRHYPAVLPYPVTYREQYQPIAVIPAPEVVPMPAVPVVSPVDEAALRSLSGHINANLFGLQATAEAQALTGNTLLGGSAHLGFNPSYQPIYRPTHFNRQPYAARPPFAYRPHLGRPTTYYRPPITTTTSYRPIVRPTTSTYIRPTSTYIRPTSTTYTTYTSRPTYSYTTYGRSGEPIYQVHPYPEGYIAPRSPDYEQAVHPYYYEYQPQGYNPYLAYY